MQRKIVAEEPVHSVLSGQMHDKAIRTNKIMNEALLRLLLDKFQHCINEEYPEGKYLEDMIKCSAVTF